MDYYKIESALRLKIFFEGTAASLSIGQPRSQGFYAKHQIRSLFELEQKLVFVSFI